MLAPREIEEGFGRRNAEKCLCQLCIFYKVSVRFNQLKTTLFLFIVLRVFPILATLSVVMLIIS